MYIRLENFKITGKKKALKDKSDIEFLNYSNSFKYPVKKCIIYDNLNIDY